MQSCVFLTLTELCFGRDQLLRDVSGSWPHHWPYWHQLVYNCVRLPFYPEQVMYFKSSQVKYCFFVLLANVRYRSLPIWHGIFHESFSDSEHFLKSWMLSVFGFSGPHMPDSIKGHMLKAFWLIFIMVQFFIHIKFDSQWDWAVNQISISTVILASHGHKNKIIKVKQLLFCVSQRVGKCCVCVLERLRCIPEWHPESSAQASPVESSPNPRFHWFSGTAAACVWSMFRCPSTPIRCVFGVQHGAAPLGSSSQETDKVLLWLKNSHSCVI